MIPGFGNGGIWPEPSRIFSNTRKYPLVVKTTIISRISQCLLARTTSWENHSTKLMELEKYPSNWGLLLWITNRKIPFLYISIDSLWPISLCSLWSFRKDVKIFGQVTGFEMHFFIWFQTGVDIWRMLTFPCRTSRYTSSFKASNLLARGWPILGDWPTEMTYDSFRWSILPRAEHGPVHWDLLPLS